MLGKKEYRHFHLCCDNRDIHFICVFIAIAGFIIAV